MENTCFYAVVVLYNTNVNESITCQKILKIKNHNIKIIIADNSTKKNNNDFLSKKMGFEYLSMNGNKGLSKAYNKVLDYLKNKDGIVIWFDDDTNVTQEYFDKLSNAVSKYSYIDIFAPIIMGQDNKLWSPNHARFFKNKQLRNIKENISDKEFNAINSCTAVRLNILRTYRYDERLFLDQVDHSFYRDQRNKNRKFMKLDCVIHHNFSTKSRMDSYDALKNRYSIMIPDFLTYCSSDKKSQQLGYIIVIGWGVRECIKYKHPDFLLWCIKQANKWKRQGSID